DMRRLGNSFITEIPKVCQTVVIGGAGERYEFIKCIRRGTTDHHVVAGIFSQAVHRVRPLLELWVYTVEKTVDRTFRIIVDGFRVHGSVGGTLQLARIERCNCSKSC